jgi:UPF0755 protein
MYIEATGRGMSIDDIITLASVVEREAKLQETYYDAARGEYFVRDDYARVSSVFHNRLLNPAAYPYLQSDITILYSYGFHKDDLTQSDLEEDLPYNTYTRRGLPPSAICNPSLKSISAALWPEENSPYFYFVTNRRGEVLAARTYDEHVRNWNIIRAERAAAAAAAN